MRNLTISDSINLNGCREYNLLRISNIESFLDSHLNNLDFYASAWKVIRDLEKEIMFENHPKDFIFIPYKPGGDVIFRLVNVVVQGDSRYVIYEFDSYFV
jgi:hypothetical protein